MGKQLNPKLGEKFGCYEVISNEIFMIKNKNNNHHRGNFLVKCSCERDQLVRADILKRGEAKRCRFCANKINYDRNVEFNKIDHKGYSTSHQGIGDLSKTQVLKIKYGAYIRNIEWNNDDMTVEYLWNLFIEQDQKCAISNLNITLSKGKNIPILTKQRNLNYSGWNASLDRIDSSKGYIKGNVQWLHRDVNIMKNAHTQEYFIELCKTIANYANQQPSVTNEHKSSNEGSETKE